MRVCFSTVSSQQRRDKLAEVQEGENDVAVPRAKLQIHAVNYLDNNTTLISSQSFITPCKCYVSYSDDLSACFDFTSAVAG
jgi:hypothetical protein